MVSGSLDKRLKTEQGQLEAGRNTGEIVTKFMWESEKEDAESRQIQKKVNEVEISDELPPQKDEMRPPIAAARPKRNTYKRHGIEATWFNSGVVGIVRCGKPMWEIVSHSRMVRKVLKAFLGPNDDEIDKDANNDGQENDGVNVTPGIPNTFSKGPYESNSE